MTIKTPDVESVFTQLEAALCLLARAKGEAPASQYFYKLSGNARQLVLDGGAFQVTVTLGKLDVDDEK